MPIYQIDSEASRVTTRARSRIHDTTTRWSQVSGTIEVDPEALVTSAAEVKAHLVVDMRHFDAGDFLRNRKLRKDLQVERHPQARFRLSTLDQVERLPATSSKEDTTGGKEGLFSARARGLLAWREREVEVVAIGNGRISQKSLEAEARFDLDVTRLGVKPPRFWRFRVEDVVSVEVTLRARPAPGRSF